MGKREERGSLTQHLQCNAGACSRRENRKLARPGLSIMGYFSQSCFSPDPHRLPERSTIYYGYKALYIHNLHPAGDKIISSLCLAPPHSLHKRNQICSSVPVRACPFLRSHAYLVSFPKRLNMQRFRRRPPPTPPNRPIILYILTSPSPRFSNRLSELISRISW